MAIRVSNDPNASVLLAARFGSGRELQRKRAEIPAIQAQEARAASKERMAFQDALDARRSAWSYFMQEQRGERADAVRTQAREWQLADQKARMAQADKDRKMKATDSEAEWARKIQADKDERAFKEAQDKAAHRRKIAEKQSASDLRKSEWESKFTKEQEAQDEKDANAINDIKNRDDLTDHEKRWAIEQIEARRANREPIPMRTKPEMTPQEMRDKYSIYNEATGQRTYYDPENPGKVVKVEQEGMGVKDRMEAWKLANEMASMGGTVNPTKEQIQEKFDLITGSGNREPQWWDQDQALPNSLAMGAPEPPSGGGPAPLAPTAPAAPAGPAAVAPEDMTPRERAMSLDPLERAKEMILDPDRPMYAEEEVPTAEEFGQAIANLTPEERKEFDLRGRMEKSPHVPQNVKKYLDKMSSLTDQEWQTGAGAKVIADAMELDAMGTRLSDIPGNEEEARYRIKDIEPSEIKDQATLDRQIEIAERRANKLKKEISGSDMGLLPVMRRSSSRDSFNNTNERIKVLKARKKELRDEERTLKDSMAKAKLRIAKQMKKGQ